MKERIRAFVKKYFLTPRYCEDIADVVYDDVRSEVVYILAIIWIGGVLILYDTLNAILADMGFVILTVLVVAIYVALARCTDGMNDIR